MNNANAAAVSITPLPENLPLARDRDGGWVVPRDNVVLVRILETASKPEIWISTGLVCDVTKPKGAVAAHQVKVWADEVLPPLQQDHSCVIDITSHTILKPDEAEQLRDPMIAMRWFEGIYSPEVIAEIALSLAGARLQPASHE